MRLSATGAVAHALPSSILEGSGCALWRWTRDEAYSSARGEPRQPYFSRISMLSGAVACWLQQRQDLCNQHVQAGQFDLERFAETIDAGNTLPP